MRLLLTLLLSLTVASGCTAGEADIKKNIEARFPGAKVDSISKTKMSGLYEVVVDGSQILYSDANATYVLIGEMMNTKTRENITRAKMDKLMEVKFDTLPLNQAIKQVKGDGSRKLAVFSDPDCPYCRKAQAEIVKLNNVTVYMFPFPLPMHQDAARKAKMVWCSADPDKAWDELLLNGKLPENGKTDCDNPIEANMELAQKLRIDGTPALIFANGKRSPGYLPADRIEAALAAAASGK